MPTEVRWPSCACAHDRMCACVHVVRTLCACRRQCALCACPRLPCVPPQRAAVLTTRLRPLRAQANATSATSRSPRADANATPTATASAAQCRHRAEAPAAWRPTTSASAPMCRAACRCRRSQALMARVARRTARTAGAHRACRAPAFWGNAWLPGSARPPQTPPDAPKTPVGLQQHCPKHRTWPNAHAAAHVPHAPRGRRYWAAIKDGSAHCGRRIAVSYGGRSVTLTVMDTCPACASDNHVDMGLDALIELTGALPRCGGA